MSQIAQQENFELREGLDYIKWAQDFKTIIEQHGQKVVVVNERVDENYLDEMKYKYGIYPKRSGYIATGGNSFIGKFPNGEKWMMVGDDELYTKSYKYLSELYGIKEENIIHIPQQNYHLDMFMRPIGYPFVLIDDPELSRKKLATMDMKLGSYDYIKMNQSFNDFEKFRQKDYASHKNAIKALENAGFIPIKIAGVFGSGINFMNAIVNQHPNGSISYITNSSKCDSPFVSKLEQEFEQELRSKVSNIDRVYFIKGNEEYFDPRLNYMSYHLENKGGGIHCMSLEEPDFEAWA